MRSMPVSRSVINGLLLGACVASGAIAALVQLPTRVIPATTRRDPVYAGMVGQWQGTLEVRDAHNGAQRVKFPAKVRVQPLPESDALEMHVTARSASGADFSDTDRLLFDKALTAAQWGGLGDSLPLHFDVQIRDSASAATPLRLVLEGETSVDEIPATRRQTVTILPGEIRIVQETRRFGQQFEFDRELRVRRVS